MNPLLEKPEILDVPEVESAPVDLKKEWLEHLAKATCPSSGLAQLTVPPREPILGEWFKQGDLGSSSGRVAWARPGSQCSLRADARKAAQ